MGVLIRCVHHHRRALSGVAPAAIRLEAQGVSTPGLTAAFLFNFVKFTTWPADALRDGSPIVVCVSGNDQVADALVQLTTNKTVEGHALGDSANGPRPAADGVPHRVRRVPRREPRAGAGPCDVGPSDPHGERPGRTFAERGGVANFFIDGGRMRFAVNPDAADRARLRISSRLLTLAKLVRDPSGPR